MLALAIGAGCTGSSSTSYPDLSDAALLDTSSDRAADRADLASSPDLPAADSRSPDSYSFHWPDLAADRPLKNLDGLSEQALRTALYNLVKGHTKLGYNGAKAAMFIPKSGGIDVHGGMIECVYTGIKVAADGTTGPGGFNVEHSWPQSEGADKAPADSDLHHLFPAEANANSRRSNLAFGETACGTGSFACSWEVGGSKIGYSASGPKVFQVRPERRGDIARAHFYFAVRYQKSIPADEESVLRRWNALDLPDVMEQVRTGDIEKLQHNRNPFIDRPDFVEHITDF